MSRQRITNLCIENVDKTPEKQKSPKTPPPKRTSLTPQRSANAVIDLTNKKDTSGIPLHFKSLKEIVKTLTLSVELNRRSRSLSPNEMKPEPVNNSGTPKRVIINGKKMIDEMFKLAKEDVHKRIASIDKRLIESGNYDSSRSSRIELEPSDNNRTKTSETQSKRNSPVVSEGIKASPKTPEKKNNKAADKSQFFEEATKNPEREILQAESDRLKVNETPKKDAKLARKPKAVTPPPTKQLPFKTTPTNVKVDTPEKDKSPVKSNSLKPEKNPTPVKDRHTDSQTKKTSSSQAPSSNEGID